MWKSIVLLSLFVYCASCVEVSPVSSPSTNVSIAIYWDECTQSILFTDFFSSAGNPTIFRYDFNEDKTYSASIPGQLPAVFIVPINGCNKYKNQYLVGLGQKAVIIEWDGKSPVATIIREVFNLNSNDPTLQLYVGKTDAQGHFYVGTLHSTFCLGPSNASFYMYSHEKGLQNLFNGIVVTTGVATTSNKLYNIDSCSGLLTEFQRDRNGNICNGRTVFNFHSPEIPAAEQFLAGLDIDKNGNLYTGAYADGAVIKIDPRTGSNQVIAILPGQGLAGVAFGGPNKDILFAVVGSYIIDPVNPISVSMDASPSLYKITGLGVKGYKYSRIII